MPSSITEFSHRCRGNALVRGHRARRSESVEPGPLEQPAIMRAPRIGPALAALLLLAPAVLYSVPRGVDAFYRVDDPSRHANQALDDKFDATIAGREIEAALAGNDADLARSFVDLAGARNVMIDPALQEKVTSATAEAATTS